MFSMSSLLLTSILGLSEVATGYFMVVLSLAGVAGSFICGKLADRYGRKKIMIYVFIVEIAALLIAGFVVYTKYVMVCMIFVDVCFSGFIPILAAIITDKTNESNRSESFSLLVFCINLGYSIGQIFAGLLFYNHTRWIFWGQGIAFLLTLILMGILVVDNYVPGSDALADGCSDDIEIAGTDDDKSKTDAAKSDVSESFGESRITAENVEKLPDSPLKRNSFSLLFEDKALTLYLIAVIFMCFCYSQVNYLNPLMFANYFGVEKSSHWISHIWTVNGFACVLWSPILLPMMKKHNQIFNTGIAALCYMVGLGAFYFITSESTLWVALVFTPIWTAGEVLLGTGITVFVGERAPNGYRARFQSFYQLANGFGSCLGPITMGYFLIFNSYRSGWLLVSVLCVLSLGILIMSRIIDKRQEYRLK